VSQYRSNRITFAFLLAVCLSLSVQLSWSRPIEEPSGIANFGAVTNMLFRGAQPSASGFGALHLMGVSIIVNFRHEAAQTAREKQIVESLGMRYVGIPWNGRDYPSTAQVVQFLDLVRANPGAKIFVHCQRGADRTGTMVAAYRIVIERKPVPEAVSEMHRFRYSHFWLPGLERYVKSLPQLLQTEPQFAGYASVPAAVVTLMPGRPAVEPAVAGP
jgi:hypothetical protein